MPDMDVGMTVGLIKALGSPDPAVIEGAVSDWLDDHPEATTTVEDGAISYAKLDSSLQGTVDDVGDLKTQLEQAIEDFAVPTQEAVDNWLDAHPEATTTVVDGSLTESKFAESLIIKTIKDYVTPQMYGAKADGTTDDTTAVQAALSAANTGHGAVYFPDGTYLITSGLTVYDKSVVEMSSKAVIKAGAAMQTVLSINVDYYPTQRPEFRNISIDGNNLATNGVYIDRISMPGSVSISGMTVKNCTGTGIIFENCQGGVFEAIRATQNGGDGVHIMGCNVAKFFSVSATQNGGDGILFAKTTMCTGTPCGYGIHSEANQGHGLKIGAQTGPVFLYGGYFESNDDVPIYIDDAGKCFIEGFRILWGESDWTENKSYCTVNSNLATIRGCELQAGPHTTLAPNIINNTTPIIDDVITATRRGYDVYGTHKNEKLAENIIAVGDMNTASGISVNGADRTYKSEEIVDTEAGRSYSLKCVITSPTTFSVSINDTEVLQVGELYKITCRVYYVGNNDTTLRPYFRNTTTGEYTYAEPQPIGKNEWNEITAYFYALESGEIRFYIGLYTSYPAEGDIYYLSTYFVQRVSEKAKISTKRIGANNMYETIEPVTIN